MLYKMLKIVVFRRHSKFGVKKIGKLRGILSFSHLLYVIYSLISSSEGLQPGTLLFLTLSSFLLKDVNVIGLEIIYMSLQGW